MNIADDALRLFLDLAGSERGGWFVTPKDNVTQLRRAGLITTDEDRTDTQVHFTNTGRALAAKHGIKIPD